MITPEQLQQLRDLVQPASSIVILIGDTPNYDSLAAASGLASAFEQLGKSVIFAGPLTEDKLPAQLAGFEKYTTSLGNQNLVVSFDYSEEAVENVSYHIGEESGKFFLTVKPQKGYPPLDTSSVQFSYAGVSADLVILVGVGSYDALNELYSANEQLFADTTVVALNTYQAEVGLLKLDAAGEVGLSAAVARIARELQAPLDGEAATNLLAGIEQTTNNFKSLSVTADTLDLAAWLMRQGARRVWRGDDNGVAKDNQAFAQVFSQKTEATEKPAKKNKKPKVDEEAKIGSLHYQPSVTAEG